MKKIKNEIIDIFLHITALPKKNMKGFYKKFLLFLLKSKAIMHLRKKYGFSIANKVIGALIFDFTIYGEKIKMTDNDYFEYFIMHLRDEVYEPSLTLKLKNLFEKNKSTTFIDIGAHYGFFSLMAGKCLGPEGKIISIEPNANYFNRLNYNISLNNLNNFVKTYNIGLYDAEGSAKMGGWNNRVTNLNKDGDVTLVTFDSFCEKENILPDIIKIDVHGAEGNILLGMPNVLKNHVSHLFCELHYTKVMNGFTAEDIVKILVNAGLHVYEFTQHRYESGGNIVPISSEFFSHYFDRVIYASRSKELNS